MLKNLYNITMPVSAQYIFQQMAMGTLLLLIMKMSAGVFHRYPVVPFYFSKNYYAENFVYAIIFY